MPLCIVAIIAGNCATATPGTILNKKHKADDKAQQWAIEKEGDDRFAFKCASNGQYLRATTGAAYGVITTGEKQWWIAEPGDAPEALWLKCADFPDAYLANASASPNDGNKIYVWPKQMNWALALQWYLQEPGHSGAIGLVEKGSQSQKAEADLKSQQEASKAKEEQLAKLQTSLEAKEKELRDLEANIKTREAELAQAKSPAPSEHGATKDTPKDDAKRSDLAQENARLKRELAETKATLGRVNKSKSQAHSPGALQLAVRRLPPPVRPAQSLPRGYDQSLAARAAWRTSRVEEL